MWLNILNHSRKVSIMKKMKEDTTFSMVSSLHTSHGPMKYQSSKYIKYG